MHTFKRILQFARPYKGSFVLTVIFNILYSLFATISTFSLIPILQVLFEDTKVETISKVPPEGISFSRLKFELLEFVNLQLELRGKLVVLGWFCLITIGLFFLRNLFRYLSQYYLVVLRTGVIADIKTTIYDKILALPVAYFTDQRKGDLMTRVSSDVNEVQRFILVPLVEIFRAPFMLIVLLISLIYMNAQLTLAALIILPIMGYVISTISKSLKKNAKRAQTELSRLLSYVEETLGASKIIKIFNAEHAMRKRFSESNQRWKKITIHLERRHSLASPTSEFLGSVTMIALVWFGGKLIFEGEGYMDGATFLVFIAAFFQMLDPAKLLSKSISDISRGNVSAERIFEILDTDITVKDTSGAIEVKGIEKEIKFDKINFEYIEGEPIIKDFSLTIPVGKTVALVGQSGSGKSTIANLLTRFYDVTKGQITLDGKPINQLKIDSYRKLIGMVTQDSVLFNDTVGNNIAMGKEGASEEEIIAAAKIANAHEFIEKLPEQYNENVGESGGKLSGGQKQRLSIARAVLKNPPIMVLDEATSALDTHSERLVQDALEHMMANRTSLVIAHRLSTIQNADLIVVMENGEIKESGKHDELIAQGGIYAKLIEMQNFS